MNLSTPTLLPGLVDKHTEFFDHMGSDHMVKDGSVNICNGFPHFFEVLLDTAIANDPMVQKGLELLEITGTDERRMKFYDCNYSACDNAPDVTATGELGPREYVACPNRGTCVAEGKLCRLPYGFTKRERDVVREIGLGLLDKEICQRLAISQDTLRNHKDNAAAKAGIERKASLAVIAHKCNLI